MSMISEQVKRLRDMAVEYSESICLDLHMALKDAADTIEELSAKLSEENMERSSAHYQGGWIPVSEKLPEENTFVLVCYSNGAIFIASRCGESWFEHFYRKVLLSIPVAWMPFPDPYREDVEDDKE